MLYKVIGLMSGSSLDGLDMVYAHLHETAGKWTYEIMQSACYPYTAEWVNKLKKATALSALEYQLLHTEYGYFIAQQVNRFIDNNNLHYQVQLIASHGHTTFHLPHRRMTAQLGDGATIAAHTHINVISDLRNMDVALGGQGAPIVPIGEKLLLIGYDFFLNLGGIANVSAASPASGESDDASVSKAVRIYRAFDVCASNQILNMLANEKGKAFDEKGEMASQGSVNTELLEKLNQLSYYSLPYPKSLANDFGISHIYPIIKDSGCMVPDALCTYVEHICVQVKNSIELLFSAFPFIPVEIGKSATGPRLLVTGGGAHNFFLIERLKKVLDPLKVELVVPDLNLVDYKEALIMGLMGVLRWRDENNVLSTATGASRDSIGGAVWMGE